MTDTPQGQDGNDEQETDVTEPAKDEEQPQPEKAELVERDKPGAEVVPIRERDSALDRAAEAAMQMPGIPGRDEFLSLAMQARVLSMSGLTPPAIRDNPHNAFYIAMVGRDLGLSPTAAIELIDVIGRDGKERASLSPQLMNAQIRRLGLGSVIPMIRTADRCVAGAFGPGGPDRRCKLMWAKGVDDHVDDCECDMLGTTEFTWADAQTAGLVGIDCQPGAHGTKCVANAYETAARYKCQQGWRTYPRRMLWWRAGGYAADDYFPEAGLGLYSPEELGAMVDDEGRPIDPATVSLPEGYEPAAVGAGQGGGSTAGAGGGEEPADPDELVELQVRVRALPEAQQTSLRERWRNLNSLQHHTLWRLPQRRLQLVQSIVRGVETDAEKAGGWDKDAARQAAREEIGAAVAAALAFVAPTAQVAQDEPAGEATDEQPASDGGSPGEAGQAETAEQPTLDEAAEPEDPDVVRRQRLDAAPPEVIDAVVEQLRPMKGHEIDPLLSERHASLDGDVPTRKQRLAALLVIERLDELDAADEQPPAHQG